MLFGGQTNEMVEVQIPFSRIIVLPCGTLGVTIGLFPIHMAT